MRHLIILTALIFTSLNAHAKGSVSVKGYTKKDGTYVAPHIRSAPDGIKSNNWSTYGNVNPYTGQVGTKNSNEFDSISSNQNADTFQSSNLNEELPNTIPKNAKLNYLGTGWECKYSFRRVSNQCVLVNIPQNARLNYIGNDWECSRGYRRVEGVCVAVSVPPNGKLNYIGNGWECLYGFKRNGSECDAVSIPEHGKLNYLGNDWECERGYRRDSNKCTSVLVPKNATLNYLGNGWQCVAGYKLTGSSCELITKALNSSN